MLKKTIKIAMLFDYYGRLLTERQQQIIQLYYLHDLSLGEIAEKIDISRQGVYDHLNRAENLLYEYENILHLAKQNRITDEKVGEIISYIDEIDLETDVKDKLKEKIREIKSMF